MGGREPGASEAAVKLVLTRGPAGADAPTGYVWIAPMPAGHAVQRARGLRVVTLARGFDSAAFADAPVAARRGQDAVLRGEHGRAARGRAASAPTTCCSSARTAACSRRPTGSVVWASGRVLHTTPTGDTGILAGTTQRLLFERAPAAGWQVRETLGTVDDLHAADVVWVISSVRGPVDVIELDGKQRERVPDVDAEIRRLCGLLSAAAGRISSLPPSEHGRTLAVHERGGGPKLIAFRTREVAAS